MRYKDQKQHTRKQEKESRLDKRREKLLKRRMLNEKWSKDEGYHTLSNTSQQSEEIY